MARRQKQPAEQRRSQIIEAAKVLFARRGFARSTVKEIAHTAGVSEGTIYIYFTSKQEILFAMAKSEILDPLTELFTGDEIDDAMVIRTFIRGQFERFDSHREQMQIMFREIFQYQEQLPEFFQSFAKPAMQVIEQYVARRIAAGVFRPLNTAVFVRSLIGALRFYSLVWEGLLDGLVDPIPREELIEEIATLFLRGVLKDPGDRSVGVPPM